MGSTKSAQSKSPTHRRRPELRGEPHVTRQSPPRQVVVTSRHCQTDLAEVWNSSEQTCSHPEKTHIARCGFLSACGIFVDAMAHTPWSRALLYARHTRQGLAPLGVRDGLSLVPLSAFTCLT